jgi:hypothetical protein
MLVSKVSDPLVLHGCHDGDVIHRDMHKGIKAVRN